MHHILPYLKDSIHACSHVDGTAYLAMHFPLLLLFNCISICQFVATRTPNPPIYPYSGNRGRKGSHATCTLSMGGYCQSGKRSGGSHSHQHGRIQTTSVLFLTLLSAQVLKKELANNVPDDNTASHLLSVLLETLSTEDTVPTTTVDSKVWIIQRNQEWCLCCCWVCQK